MSCYKPSLNSKCSSSNRLPPCIRTLWMFKLTLMLANWCRDSKCLPRKRKALWSLLHLLQPWMFSNKDSRCEVLLLARMLDKALTCLELFKIYSKRPKHPHLGRELYLLSLWKTVWRPNLSLQQECPWVALARPSPCLSLSYRALRWRDPHTLPPSFQLKPLRPSSECFRQAHSIKDEKN